MSRQRAPQRAVEASAADLVGDCDLRSPTEVKNVVRYVLANHARHVPGAAVHDRWSSAATFADWEAIRLPPATVEYAPVSYTHLTLPTSDLV